MATEPYETLSKEQALSTHQSRPLHEGKEVPPNAPPEPPYAAPEHPHGGPPGQTGENPGHGGEPPGQADKPPPEPEPKEHRAGGHEAHRGALDRGRH